MTTFDDLPPPNSADLKRSQLLTEVIQQTIKQEGGLISFATFMDLALYHPELGYYTRETMAFGKSGDFTTAPEISPLFAKCFAKPCLQISEQLGRHVILELGAGSGRFAGDLLTEMAKQQALPSHYYILEISPGLRKKQQDWLQATCPDFFQRIHWLEQLPTDFTGTIIANEVLDALPVHRFLVSDQGIQECCVAFEKDQFIWQPATPTTSHLSAKAMELTQRYSLASGYTSEINLGLPAFIQALSTSLTKGMILFVDYGYGQRDYYSPLRNQGTLACFYQHRLHHHPLILPGLQDITAHVDFTSVIEYAVENGCSLQGYTSQAAFLLANGLTEFVQQAELTLSPVEIVTLRQAIKMLTLPTEMGERINVMALSKNLALPSLLGFDLQDRRRDL